MYTYSILGNPAYCAYLVCLCAGGKIDHEVKHNADTQEFLVSFGYQRERAVHPC